eukprot:scaffold43937_cov61-Phaeocystis_antarctica.AAC.2
MPPTPWNMLADALSQNRHTNHKFTRHQEVSPPSRRSHAVAPPAPPLRSAGWTQASTLPPGWRTLQALSRLAIGGRVIGARGHVLAFYAALQREHRVLVRLRQLRRGGVGGRQGGGLHYAGLLQHPPRLFARAERRHLCPQGHGLCRVVAAAVQPEDGVLGPVAHLLVV